MSTKVYRKVYSNTDDTEMHREARDLSLHATNEALKAIARVAALSDRLAVSIILSAAMSVFVGCARQLREGAPSEETENAIEAALKAVVDAVRRS